MGRFSMLRFISDQWLTVPELEKQDLSGQTVLVVGANVGLGLLGGLAGGLLLGDLLF